MLANCNQLEFSSYVVTELARLDRYRADDPSWRTDNADEKKLADYSTMYAGAFLQTHARCHLKVYNDNILIQDLNMTRWRSKGIPYKRSYFEDGHSWPETLPRHRTLYFEQWSHVSSNACILREKELPPVQELFLLTRLPSLTKEVKLMWDFCHFSQLRSLFLQDPHLLSFLRAVPPSKVQLLEKF